MPLTLPPRWSDVQFEADSVLSITSFRELRMREPLEEYGNHFERYRTAVEELLEASVDLSELTARPWDFVGSDDQLYALRYLASPPISEDDLKVVAEVSTLVPQRLSMDIAWSRRVVESVLLGLDRNRFPWVGENRDATQAERLTAVISTTALIATQRQQTRRRNDAKELQEEAVAQALRDHGFRQVQPRNITALSQGPQAGEFCRESMFGTRKADLVIGLYDGRVMPAECKVSNSATNSVKRLNNDAAVKAVAWLHEFGSLGVVPAAIIAGVFKLRNLKAAQDAGLTIFWGHDLRALLDFIDTTKS